MKGLLPRCYSLRIAMVSAFYLFNLFFFHPIFPSCAPSLPNPPRPTCWHHASLSRVCSTYAVDSRDFSFSFLHLFNNYLFLILFSKSFTSFPPIAQG